MATSPSPFGAVPGAGQPGPANSSTLIGSTPLTPPRPAGPTPDQIISAYMDQIRSLHVTIDGLAQQFPAAASDLNSAKTALANSMSKVASSQSQPEASPTTPTF